MSDVFEVELGGYIYEVPASDNVQTAEDAVAIAMGAHETPTEQDKLPELFHGSDTKVPANRRAPSHNTTIEEQISSKLSLATSPEDQADIILQFMPDAKIDPDFPGVRVTGIHPDTREPIDGVLDKEGISGRNVDQAMSLGTLFAPGASVASLVTRGGVMGNISRGGVSAAMEGLTEAGRQYLVGQFNPDTDVRWDPNSILLAAVGGGVGEEVGAAMSWLTRKVRNPFYVRDGRLTDRGKKLFSEVGIDPKIVEDNPEIIHHFQKTPGGAGNAMGPATEGVRPDLVANTEISGRARPSIRSMREASASVLAQAQNSKEAVNKAYETAKRFNAALNPAAVEKAINDTENFLNQAGYLIRDGAPKKVLKDLQKTLVDADNLGDVQENTVKAYEIWRKQASGRKRDLGMKKVAQKAAIGEMISQMDSQVLTMFRDGLVKGDPQSILLWNRAIAKSAAYTKKFTANHIIESIATDKLLPDETAKFLFRAGKATPRVEAIQGLKAIVGEDSESWAGFKSEFITQVTQQGQKSSDVFDANAFQSKWSKLKREDPTFLNSILDEREIEILNDLARSAPKENKGTMLAGIADLISLRYGVQGNAIAGSFRRTANRVGGFVQGQRPMLSGIGAVGGSTTGVMEGVDFSEIASQVTE